MLVSTEVRMPRGRALKLLEQEVAIDIFWSIASKERLKNLRAIPFPIYKGMFGYRLLLIKSSSIDEFLEVTEEAKLQAKVAGLGHDWPDFKILADNGYTVQGSSSYAGLFQLLQKGRLDYLPRSIFEIHAEQEYFSQEGIIVAPLLALHYPVDFYFFVSKSNSQLAEDILDSLNDLQAQGKVDLLFNAIHGVLLEQAGLNQRTVFELSAEPIND